MSTEARPLPPTPERPPSPPATAPRVPLPRLRPPGAAGAERASGETPEAAAAEAR
ncbi:hypothetical protein GA0115257_11721, partial [Streptomyces sp. LcepLS]